MHRLFCRKHSLGPKKVGRGALSAIHKAMTRFNFMHEVGRFGDNMWLQGADQLVLWVF